MAAAMAQACGWAVPSSSSCTRTWQILSGSPVEVGRVGGLPERWACSWGGGEEGESSTMCAEARNIMWSRLLYSVQYVHGTSADRTLIGSWEMQQKANGSTCRHGVGMVSAWYLRCRQRMGPCARAGALHTEDEMTRYSVLRAVPGFPFHGIGLGDEMTGVGVETSVPIASVDHWRLHA